MISELQTAETREEALREFIELADETGRRQYLARHRELLRPDVVVQLTDAAKATARTDAQRALGLAKTAVAIARRIRDKESLARSLRALANALYGVGKNTEAVRIHERAISAWEALGNPLEVGIGLSSSVQPLILLGEYDRALASAERARRIFTDLGEERRVARLDINVGNILHRQDRFEEALMCYERSYQRLRAGEDKEAVAAVLSNLAVCLTALNDFPRALETYQTAKAFCQQHDMPLLTDLADYNIAWLYYLRGEYSRAIQLLLVTREACRNTHDVYQLALCYLDLSEIYLELNLSGEAAETARQGRQLFRDSGVGYEGAKCLANEAIALGQQGKAFRALELFAQARKEFVHDKNWVWPWLIDLYQALVLVEEGRLFEARRLCQKAKAFFAKSTLPGKAVLCSLLLARISLRSGDAEAAERECQAALDRLQTLESPSLLCQGQSLMGEIRRRTQDYEGAYRAFQVAREALETLRNSLQGEELKIAFLKNKLDVYEGLVEICLERRPGQAGFEEAFSYIEEAKSRILTDLLQQRVPIFPPGDEGKSDLVRKIRELREELNWYYHRIDIEQLRPEERSPERIEKLRQQAKTREEEFLRTLREVQAGAEMPLGAPRGISLEEIRASLPAETTLVEYFTVGDRIVACILHGETLEIQGVTLVSRVADLLRMLQFQVSKFRLGEEYIKKCGDALLHSTNHHLRELYEELIAPIRDKLKERHVVVIPHELLHYLPFHAFHDGASYLADHFTVSYAPSATLFCLCQNKPPRTTGNSLVLGVPDENAPAILDEVRSVAAVLPSAELFVGSEANLEILKSHGPHSRYIHLATHGEFRQDNPLFSGIRLGDARLNLYDLYQLQLPADLVTLSGCATGMNAVAAGDELLGLVRGLFFAGARTILLTLWDVHDQTTAEFMTSFYRNMDAGQSKPEALRQAAIEVRSRHPHPYYWAPFFLVGNSL